MSGSILLFASYCDCPHGFFYFILFFFWGGGGGVCVGGGANFIKRGKNVVHVCPNTPCFDNSLLPGPQPPPSRNPVSAPAVVDTRLKREGVCSIEIFRLTDYMA